MTRKSPSRRILRTFAIVAVWMLVTGTTVIKCSSGGESDFDFGHPNRAPVAADGFYQTPSSSSVIGRMAATDPDDDDLTFSVVSGPSLGSLRNFDSSTGFFTYVPGQIGSDNFSFRASDGRLSSNTANVNILVTLQGKASSETSRPLVAVHSDPLEPGGLLLLWAAPASRLEKLSADGAGRELLAIGVAYLEVDPARPGWLWVRDLDGARRVSTDGGRHWQPVPGAAATPDEVRKPDAGLTDRNAATHIEDALAVAPDPFAQHVQLAVTNADHGSRIWRSDGVAPASVTADALPGPADAAGLMADPGTPDRWFLRLDQGATTRILHSIDGGSGWAEIVSLDEARARMLDCASHVCLLSEDGHRLWRFRRAAATAPSGPGQMKR